MKQLKVSDRVHTDLDDIKEEEGHTSFDSAIRQLISDRRNLRNEVRMLKNQLEHEGNDGV